MALASYFFFKTTIISNPSLRLKARVCVAWLSGVLDDRMHLAYDVEQMGSQPSVGQFEQLVLTAILRCGKNAYGVTIHAAVEQLSGAKSVALGAVYATLDRLEDKGLISSWLSDPTPERGGRSKRHFRLEADGERGLRESVLTARRVCAVVEDAWGSTVWTGKWTPARPR